MTILITLEWTIYRCRYFPGLRSGLISEFAKWNECFLWIKLNDGRWHGVGWGGLTDTILVGSWIPLYLFMEESYRVWKTLSSWTEWEYIWFNGPGNCWTSSVRSNNSSSTSMRTSNLEICNYLRYHQSRWKTQISIFFLFFFEWKSWRFLLNKTNCLMKKKTTVSFNQLHWARLWLTAAILVTKAPWLFCHNLHPSLDRIEETHCSFQWMAFATWQWPPQHLFIRLIQRNL